jgi:predicted nucleic acid-binding protein
MKKVFLDTNIWLRFLTADEPNQFQSCCQLLERIEEGKIRAYTSVIVLLEIIYTLTSYYKIARKQVIEDVKNLLATRNLILIEKTNFATSFDLFSKHQVKLADCLIATQVPKGALLCTYDQDFKKIKGVVSSTPQEILNN